MNCREFVEVIVDYVHNELPEAQCVIFEQHIYQCPGCKAYLETYRATILLCKSCCETPAQAEEQLPETLVQAILSAKKCLGKPPLDGPAGSSGETLV